MKALAAAGTYQEVLQKIEHSGPVLNGLEAFFTLFVAVLAVVVIVHIGFLRDAGFAVLGLNGTVQGFVPEQGAAGPLLGFQRGLGSLELGYEFSGFGVVVGAAKEGHAV